MKHTTNSSIKTALLFFILALTTNVQANASARYITDKLFVPLRSGMGNQFRIVHKGLPSGYIVEFIEEASDEAGVTWVHVKTQKGLEGWVRQQYVFDKPTAAIQLAALTKKVGQMSGDKKDLINEIESLKAENSTLKKQQVVLQDTLKKTNRDFVNLRKLASNAIKLEEQHNKLNENHQILQTRTEVLTGENEQLKNNDDRSDWLFGAFLLIAGIITSFILQAIGRRQRQSEWR